MLFLMLIFVFRFVLVFEIMYYSTTGVLYNLKVGTAAAAAALQGGVSALSATVYRESVLSSGH